MLIARPPSDMRFADNPEYHIRIKATSMQKGIAAAVMKELLPELSCGKELPGIVRQVVESGGRGVQNAKGFYEYTPESAKRWEELFLKFTYDIRALAMKYPEDAAGGG